MRFTRMGFLDALSIFKVFLDSIDVSVFVLRRLEKCILLKLKWLFHHPLHSMLFLEVFYTLVSESETSRFVYGFCLISSALLFIHS